MSNTPNRATLCPCGLKLQNHLFRYLASTTHGNHIIRPLSLNGAHARYILPRKAS